MKKIIAVSVLAVFLVGCFPRFQVLTAPVPAGQVQIAVTVQTTVEAKATPICAKRGIMEKLIGLLKEVGVLAFERLTGVTVFSEPGAYVIMLPIGTLPFGGAILAETGAPTLKSLLEALQWGSIEYELGDRSKGDILNRYKIPDDVSRLPDC